MNRARTRRQAAMEAHSDDKIYPTNGSANGHAISPRREPSSDRQDENIFLFYPNIIGEHVQTRVTGTTTDRLHLGYSRIILAVASLYYMPLHPRTCSLLYSVSCLLDALDGLAARRFEQSTRFGAVLDMVTDRCTTSCLLVFLSSAFPRWALLFQGLISLDFASHYIHMYATLTMGDQNKATRRWIRAGASCCICITRTR